MQSAMIENMRLPVNGAMEYLPRYTFVKSYNLTRWPDYYLADLLAEQVPVVESLHIHQIMIN